MESFRLDFDKSPCPDPLKVRTGEQRFPEVRILLTDHGRPYEPRGDVTLECRSPSEGFMSAECERSGQWWAAMFERLPCDVEGFYAADTAEGFRATTGNVAIVREKGGPCSLYR